MSIRRLIVHACELRKTSESNLPKLPPNARSYLRWKRNFQKLILVSVRHPFTCIFLRSRAAVAFEKRRHGRSPYWWTIHPCSDFRYYWDSLMAFVLLYIFISMPYIISFHRIAKNAGPECWNFINPAYFICIFDIILNFITGYASRDAYELFLDPILVARHYAEGYFMIDLVSSIPYALLYSGRVSPPGPDTSMLSLVPEFLLVLKLFRVPTLHYYIKQIMTNFGISHARETIIWLVLLTLLIFHWSSCITCIFPYIIMYAKGDTMKNSEAYYIETGLHKKPDWLIYLVSLHIGVSNLIGFSFKELDSLGTLDKIIRCILLLLGKGYMIYLIVIILQLMESSAEPELKYQRVMRQIKEYIRDKKLSKLLRNKLIAYYEYRFQGSFFKENAISNTISSHLNQEIIIHSSRGLIETVTILHNLPRNIIGTLMTVLKPVIYLEDDIIYKCGIEGDCMYFIVCGTVSLITFQGKEVYESSCKTSVFIFLSFYCPIYFNVKVCHEQDGSHFGEAALIYPDKRRLETVIALEACELLRLDRRDFKRLFSSKSEFYTRLERVANVRLEKIQELNKIYNDSDVKDKTSA